MISHALLTLALHKKIKGCIPNPVLVTKVEQALDELTHKGWQPRVVDICRTLKDQKEKIRQGYSQTIHSLHLVGRAADIIDRRYAWDVDDNFQFWKDLGQACRRQNLIWGGAWHYFKDVAHCQLRKGV